MMNNPLINANKISSQLDDAQNMPSYFTGNQE